MTRREPEWNQAARDAAMALEEHEADRCGSCGMPRSVCQSADQEFTADGPYRCHATTAVMVAKERHGETAQPEALHWIPVPRD